MWIAVWLAVALASGAFEEEIAIRLRVDRTVLAEMPHPLPFPGPSKRVGEGYQITVDGQIHTVASGGSIAVESHGLPFVVRESGGVLSWTPHYQAEGVLTVAPCRERMVVFDSDGNGKFDDLSTAGSVGVDVFHDGQLRFGQEFEICGRVVSAESIALDGSSMVVRAMPKMRAQAGHAAPEVSLLMLDGTAFRVAGKRQKPLLLDFWATWCSVCLGEYPALRKLHESGAVEIVSINVDDGSAMEEARKIVRDEKPAWRQMMTGQGEATSAWQVFEPLSYAGGLPLYVLIDERGVIRYGGTGGGTSVPEVRGALAGIGVK